MCVCVCWGTGGGGFSWGVWVADVATTKNRELSRKQVGKASLGCDESEVLAEHKGDTSRKAGLGLRGE